MAGKRWREVRKNWKRTAFEKKFGALQFSRVVVPYASYVCGCFSFSYSNCLLSSTFSLEETPTTVTEHMHYMSNISQTLSELSSNPGAPTGYIFGVPPPDSPLFSETLTPGLTNFFPPPSEVIHQECPTEVLDFTSVHANVDRPQFFLGPAGSGAPLHYHTFG